MTSIRVNHGLSKMDTEQSHLDRNHCYVQQKIKGSVTVAFERAANIFARVIKYCK